MRLWLMIFPCMGYVGLNGKEILNGNETMNFDSGIEKSDLKRSIGLVLTKPID